jgi:hypothetical protein
MSVSPLFSHPAARGPVQRLATGWTVSGSNSGGGDNFSTRPDRAWGPPSLQYNGYWIPFPAVARLERGAVPLHPSVLSRPVLGRTFTFTFSLQRQKSPTAVNTDQTFLFPVLCATRRETGRHLAACFGRLEGSWFGVEPHTASSDRLFSQASLCTDSNAYEIAGCPRVNGRRKCLTTVALCYSIYGLETSIWTKSNCFEGKQRWNWPYRGSLSDNIKCMLPNIQVSTHENRCDLVKWRRRKTETVSFYDVQATYFSLKRTLERSAGLCAVRAR